MPCYYAGSLNDSRVTVNECKRDNGLKSRSANNTAGSMHFVSVVHDYGRRLNQSPFRSRTEVSFPRARQFSEYNGKETSASRERLLVSGFLLLESLIVFLHVCEGSLIKTVFHI